MLPTSGSDTDEDRRLPPLPPAARCIARDLYAARRERERLLGADLFADPAWDMLLDLALSHHRRCLSVSALCLGSRVAHATATRYLQMLIERGLVRRTRDSDDRRRSYVGLTAKGLAAVERVLLAFPSGNVPEVQHSADGPETAAARWC